MDKKKTLTIGLSGNLLSDQRMQRIAQALHEDGWSVTVLYRNYYKYDAGANSAQLSCWVMMAVDNSANGTSDSPRINRTGSIKASLATASSAMSGLPP